MAYTEARSINGRNYYYRVISIRNGSKISKKRVYLGCELSNLELSNKEKSADEKLLPKKVKSSKEIKEIEKIKSKIKEVLKKNSVSRAGIFGSYSRGEQKKNSDIDILVQIEDKNMSLLGFIQLVRLLERILKRKVDLVEYSTIKPQIRERVLSEEIRII